MELKKMNNFIKSFLILAGLIIFIPIFSIAYAADPVKGKEGFKKCVACHSLEEGKNKRGPTLHNVLGRIAGSVEGYKYSKAMKNFGVVWDEESLDKFLTKPRKFIKGTKCLNGFVSGIKNKSLRDDIISYLKKTGPVNPYQAPWRTIYPDTPPCGIDRGVDCD